MLLTRGISKVVITVNDYEKIRTMYMREHMSQRAIAKALGISRNTVAKYCTGASYPGLRADYHRDASVMTPDVIQFIQQCFLEDAQERNPKQHHTARRIYDRLVEERGFTGCESSVRAAVRNLRRTRSKAYVPLEFHPGEAMQIDWGQAAVMLGQERLMVNIFCARLCYSCTPFAMCFRKQNTEAFLEGLAHAFSFFGGVPRRVIFDNARVAVKSGYGKQAVSQDRYAAFAAHYCFETVYCNPASGNEKGLVENLVGTTRRNIFVPVPRMSSMQELNEMLVARCSQYIESHKVLRRPIAVKDALEEERKGLLPLPQLCYNSRTVMEVRVSPYATARMETNNYSVPVKYVGCTVAMKAGAETVSIYSDGAEIAVHPRCYGRNQDILSLEHYLPILERKPRSILQAKPVRHALSKTLLKWLEIGEFSGRELMQILEVYVEKGEDEIFRHQAEYLSHEAIRRIPQAVEVQSVNLAAYDEQFMKGDAAACQKQA